MSEAIAITDLTYDDKGLIPAIIQEYDTGEVLMMAFMNQDSLGRTIESGRTWFWSRSRQELWNKGATSGHYQEVRRITYDCDLDCLLILVDQEGPACHTNEHTCFHRALDGSELRPAAFEILTRLFETVKQRREQRPGGSYTAGLFASGTDTILEKVDEESSELIVAAKGGDRGEVVHEAADLLYHMVVLLAQAGVGFDEVREELLKRWK